VGEFTGPIPHHRVQWPPRDQQIDEIRSQAGPFEETRDFLQELWEEWRHLRAATRADLWSPGLNLVRALG